MSDDQEENERQAAHEISSHIPRQKFIGDRERNGEQFLDFVKGEMPKPLGTSPSANDARVTARNIIKDLKPVDLKSKAMQTPEGFKALGILLDALSEKGHVDDNVKNEYQRIQEAHKEIFNELYPTKFADVADLKKTVEKNLPEFSKELQKKLTEEKEGWKVEKIYCRQADYKVDGSAIELRAVISRTVTTERGIRGDVGKHYEKRDVSLGGINQRGQFETPQQIEGRSDAVKREDPLLWAIFTLIDIKFAADLVKLATELLLKGVAPGAAREAASVVEHGMPSVEKQVIHEGDHIRLGIKDFGEGARFGKTLLDAEKLGKGATERLSVTKPDAVRDLGQKLMNRFDKLGVNKQLAMDLHSFGYSSDSINEILNRCIKEGLKPAGINKEFLIEKRLSEHYRANYGNAPIDGRVRSNIKDGHFHVSREKWFKDYTPGPKGMEKLWKNADNHVKKLEQSLRKKIPRDPPGGGPPLSIREEGSSIKKEIRMEISPGSLGEGPKLAFREEDTSIQKDIRKEISPGSFGTGPKLSFREEGSSIQKEIPKRRDRDKMG